MSSQDKIYRGKKVGNLFLKKHSNKYTYDTAPIFHEFSEVKKLSTQHFLSMKTILFVLLAENAA